MAAPAPVPALIEDLVGEILLRLPPAEPASLVRAALVCKPWCRLISGPRFRRRFREFHRTPPMLGFICNRVDEDDYSVYVARFVPTGSFRPPRPDHCQRRALGARHRRRHWRVQDTRHGRGQWRALDARHGRVLLRSMCWGPRLLAVWDPVTDEWHQLPTGPLLAYDWNAAVLCAAGGACDHLDCHRGPFLVVFVSTGVEHMNLWVYSSENGAWSATYVTQFPKYHVEEPPSAMVGNALHFVIDHSRRILKYSLATQEMSVILQPPQSYYCIHYTMVMTMEDGGLGVARMEGVMTMDDDGLGVERMEEARLSLWSMETNPDGSMGWVQIRAIDLGKLLSVDARFICSDFVGFAHGVGVFFMGTYDGLFSFDLKSLQVSKVCEGPCHYNGIRGVIPYMSFYTPELQKDENRSTLMEAAEALSQTAKAFHPAEPQDEGAGTVLLQ